MGLIDQVTRLWRRGREGGRERTTGDEMGRPVRPTGLGERLRADMARRAVVKTCRKMYATDTRAEGVICSLARDMVRGGFTVSVSGDVRAEEVAGDLVRRLGLVKRLDDWTRLTLRDGDTFLEVAVDGRMEIVEVTRKPTLQLHRNSDEFDRFADPARAFWWADELWGGDVAPPGAVWFAEWQVVHARWAHDEGSRYGRPLFASGTGAWKRITEGELDIAVRRKTRAGMKYVHVLEGAAEPDLQAYKEANKDALNDPFAAVADYFMNGAGRIDVVQGDARLAEIGDVMHHIRTWWLDSPVPMSLLGYGQDLNRDVLREQREQYERALEPLTEWVEDGFVRPLLELQWLLAGIWPGGLEYEVEWKAKQPVRAADVRDVADAALKLKALGLPGEVVWTVLRRFLPGIDVGALVGEGDSGEGGAGRLADVADRLGSGY